MQHNLSKKIDEFQDLDPTEQFPQRRVSRTLGYQNSESIQEEDEEQSSSSLQLPKPKLPFMNSSLQQPNDFSGSDMKVPTIYTNMQSNKSFEKNMFQLESKNCSRLIEVSNLDIQNTPKSDSVSRYSKQESSFLDRNKSATLNSQHIKGIVSKFLKKIKPKVDFNQLKDITLIDEQTQVQPNIYRWFTILYFVLTSAINIYSAIAIPLALAHITEAISYFAHALVLLQISADIHFKRGPFHLSEGKFNHQFQDQNKLFLDILRLLLAISLLLLYTYNVKYLIIPFFVLQLIRQAERFENIYSSTQLIMFITIMWFMIIMSLASLLEMDEEEESFQQSLTIAVSILTHNGFIEYRNENAFLLQVYMIISSFCLIYTASVILVWIKPKIKLEEEKEKHLASFLNGIKDKDIDYGLQCRCYSYLEYIVDEDITKTRDLLAKKLSPGLQEELQVSIRSKMVEKIKLFSKFSSSLKQQLIYWFDMSQYNPEENIIQEHQVEDFCLYYILKGKVKIQFQGYFQGKPKRTFQTLKEGQTFGEWSFVSGRPPFISINSQGLTTVLKLRRSDFLEIIKTFPQDNERFCQFKDNCIDNHNMFECNYCKKPGHLLFECQYLQYYPQKLDVIEKHIYPHPQSRHKMDRKTKEPKALMILFAVGERAKQYQQKLSQEMTSEDFPMSSQLPYSENQTQQSASYLSKTQSLHKYSPDNVSDGQDSGEDQLYEDLSMDPVLNNQLRKQQNKTTLRTAGFPFVSETLGTKVNKPMLENLHKEKLQVISEASQSKQFDTMNSKQEDQLSKQSSTSQAFAKKTHLYSAARSMHAKLTFRYQQQQSNSPEDQQIQFQQQQNSIRQTSNRSNTYSNPLSNNLSNNPSSNSKVNTKSARVSPTQFQSGQQKKKEEKLSHSDQSLSDQQRHTNRKKSTKTGTKVSILNQMSQFQIINTPENHHYQINDAMFNKFEKMHIFQYFNPHNNYDKVISRMNKFRRSKKTNIIHYSVKSYVGSKIRRIKKIIQSYQ